MIWRRAWDWWTGGGVGTRSADTPVAAAEWLAERRDRPPRPSVVAALVVAMGGVAMADVGALGDGSTLLWAPVLVVAVVIGSRAATVLCTAGCVATGAIAGAAGEESPGAIVVDAAFRLLGVVTVAFLTSWAVLATVELARRSRTDSWTGLLNRRGFVAALERERARAIRRHEPLSLVYLDLDGLKAANDRHGHLFGDEMLARFADHLDRCRRITDIAARLGGDEFALLLPGANTQGVDEVLGRLYRSIALDGCLPVSAGAVTWVDPPPPRSMLREADHAMYRAKQSGGQTWTSLVLGSAETAPARSVTTSRTPRT